MKKLVIYTSFGALILAQGVSIAWFIEEKDFEPFITSLLIFAALTGIFVEKWMSEKGRRKELICSLFHELYINMNTLKDPVFSPTKQTIKNVVLFPRLEGSVVKTVIASGAFTNSNDKDLYRLLHNWREKISQFNQRLEVTENNTFSNPVPENVILWREKMSSGPAIKQVRDSYNELVEKLFEGYSKKSGITRETEFF